jgi:hypothetical protein
MKLFEGEFQMKITRSVVVSLAMILLSATVIHGQDLSKYRNFSFGMSAASVSKLAEEKSADQQPALIQELAWYPPLPFDSHRPAEPVQKVVFSFYNGELYRMLVTYDSDAVKGLTNEDMIQILSARYGTATRPAAEVNFPTNDAYRSTEKVIARWEDPQYSLNLFRSDIPDTFAVVMFAKQPDAQAAAAIAESTKLELQEAPQIEAARVKQVAVDLEVERQKNIKALRP